MLARGRFGIEYDPYRRKDEDAGGGWIIVVIVMAVISFAVTRFTRSHEAEGDAHPAMQVASAVKPQSEATARPLATETEHAKPVATPSPSAAKTIATSRAATAEDRPVRVRNLLMRLEEAEKQGNVEMAASTLESLRSLPGELAADLDDTFAERLGELNYERLFTLKSRIWLTEVTVRPGEGIIRIARAHGSTAESIVKLNGLKDANHVVSGRKLLVMDHPRFTLVIHKLAGYADLNLNGKFFRRYSVENANEAANGASKLEGRTRAFFKSRAISFPEESLAELEILLPQGAAILVSEK